MTYMAWVARALRSREQIITSNICWDTYTADFVLKKITSFSFLCFLQNYCAQLLKFFNLGQTHEIGFEILTFGIWEMSIDKFNGDTHI